MNIEKKLPPKLLVWTHTFAFLIFKSLNVLTIMNIPLIVHEREHVLKTFNLIDGSGSVKQRTRRKIIRFRLNLRTNPEEYWREQLMLFVPWRDEVVDLEDVYAVQKADENMDLIKANSSFYYDCRGTDDRTLGANINEIETNQYNFDEYEEVMNEMELLENDQYLTTSLTGARPRSTTAEKFLPPKLINESEYFKLMRCLNFKQRQIVMHILHCLKAGKKPFYILVNVVGKWCRCRKISCCHRSRPELHAILQQAHLSYSRRCQCSH